MSRTLDDLLVDDVTVAVKERLADERDERGRHVRLGADDERQLARRLIALELDLVAERRMSAGLDPIGIDVEHALAEAVLANTLGLGRLQPYLDDPDVQDIHVRGAESTWLKRRDGTRRREPPVVGSDDELIELIRLIATRLGRTERRFDAAAPEPNFQLPDGSR